MGNFVIYEHIYGLPSFLDAITEELTEYAVHNCRTEKEVKEYINIINKIQPMDKYGRKRSLYVYWL